MTVQDLNTFTKGTDPQFSLLVTQNAVNHIVGQLIIDAVFATKLSVFIAVDTALCTDPHFTIRIFIETPDIKIRISTANPLHSSRFVAIYCHPIQIHPHPKVAGTVGINDIHMRILHSLWP